jgi:glycosyltransferase involved in cell wall biosynthesis
MIHFFPTFSRDAANSPYGETLRRAGVPYRILASEVRLDYRTRAKLLLVCIPRLAANAVGLAVRSLLLSRPAPDTVVLGSDVEVLVFALARRLFGRPRLRIVLASFIYTSRASPLANTLRRALFRFVLRRTALVIVHSRLEAERYGRIFAATGTRFAFVPYGGTVAHRHCLIGDARAVPGEPGIVVAPGRSGRDYATLFAAMAGAGAEVRVICNSAAALPATPPGEGITILDTCHDLDFFHEMVRAAVVAIPLAVDDISAGQMVLVQAMALGKAIVVTGTPTIRDYATDGHDALLVPRGDAPALRAAILRLLGDAALRSRLGGNAMDTYDRKFGTEGNLLGVLAAITRLGVPEPGRRP